MGTRLVVTPQELWKFGTHERVARGSPLALHARVDNGVGETDVTTFRLFGATAGYAVTAGATLVITRVLYHSTVDAGAMGFRYTDDDLGLDAAGEGTNPVYLDHETAGVAGALAAVTALVLYSPEVYYEIPAGKYFGVESMLASSALLVVAHGVEV